jgi:ABC-type branched-chain amino acid transport systems, ATPase component
MSKPVHPLLEERRLRLVGRVVLAVVALWVVLFPLTASSSAQNTMILTLVLAVGATGLNTISGYAGYLSLGHGAFLGLGAYVVAVLSRTFPEVNPLLWSPLGGVLAALVAMLLALVTFRSRGPAFVIITIAFLFLVQFVAVQWVSVTNGTAGITLPLPSWPRSLGNWPFHLVLVVVLALSLWLSWRIRRTKFGMGLVAIREDEGKAGTIGIDAPVYKLLAFAASTFFVGIAGGVYAYYVTFVDPVNMFAILMSVQIVLAMILGGRGTLLGPVLGAFVIVPLDTLANSSFGGGNARLVLFGLLLVLLCVLLPRGIIPSAQAAYERWRRRGEAELSGKRLTLTERSPLAQKHVPLTDGAPLLEVRGLSKSFGGLRAVDECSFTVPEGSITALIGPNGSGKTTVFNLVSGVMTPDSGEILLAGERIDTLPPWARAHRGLGRTFQITRLFKEMTVLENVVAPLRSFDLRQLNLGAVSGSERERTEELLEFVGMSHYRDARAGSLSYGQQKLVELAQILVLDPTLILLDEPAGGINPTLIERMGDLIRELNAQGKTFLLVEHNMPFVLGLCDPIRVLARGSVIAEGSPEEIQRDPAVLDAYLGDDYMLDSRAGAAAGSEG